MTTSYHDEINKLIWEATQTMAPRSRWLNTSPYITPNGYYQEYVDGGQCREPDGVHLYVQDSTGNFVSTPCGRALQEGVLGTIRKALAA